MHSNWRAMAKFFLLHGGFGLVMLLLTTPLLNGRAESVVALAFDGKDDFVEIPSGLILGSTFTEEAWILPQSNDTSYRGLMGYPAGSSKRAPSLWLAYGSGLHAGFGDGKKWNSVSSGSDTIVLQAWNHVAATYDGVTYRVFANGVEVVNQRFGATPLRQAVTRIGRIDNGFAGAMREVRFWKRARTAEEIRQYMTKELSGKEEGLVAYFRFDDGAGSSAKNSVSAGGVGTLKNGPRWITSSAPVAPAVFDPLSWDGRRSIAAHSPTGEDVVPNAAIEVTFLEGVSQIDPQFIQLTVDNAAVKTEVTTNDAGKRVVLYEPTQPFEPASKHTVKLSYVTTEPTRRTNDFSYSFSISSSILLSK
ncbi:MAG: hypothetical protein JWM68_3641 [Verrucomicrobiales bacterium]|nr:hypothetical protein [Verrucomicrobiales bacterium]